MFNHVNNLLWHKNHLLTFRCEVSFKYFQYLRRHLSISRLNFPHRFKYAVWGINSMKRFLVYCFKYVASLLAHIIARMVYFYRVSWVCPPFSSDYCCLTFSKAFYRSSLTVVSLCLLGFSSCVPLLTEAAVSNRWTSQPSQCFAPAAHEISAGERVTAEVAP